MVTVCRKYTGKQGDVCIRTTKYTKAFVLNVWLAWELVKNADARHHPRPTESQSKFIKCASVCALKLEKPCHIVLS